MEKKVLDILFHGARFTQDTPVLPEVWLEFARQIEEGKAGARVKLLVTPFDGKDVAELGGKFLESKWKFAHISNFATLEANVEELVGDLLPLTYWYRDEDAGRSTELFNELCRVLGCTGPDKTERSKEIWQIALNRKATLALQHSVSTTKADAARRVFDINCREIGWAIVDNGIDAGHKVFLSQGGKSRVLKRYDFSDIGMKLNIVQSDAANRGKLLDWSEVEGELENRGPGQKHGTHVAGIIGGREVANEFQPGLCQDIKLYDIKVFDDNDETDEFTILAALQFIRYLNNKVDVPVINGVNLSFSIVHKVRDFACGATPVCKECDRLVASGVVVVAAAGNYGYREPDGKGSASGQYSDISITDPGNAESVITVGATHRQMPHTYGVSYFSSRGPTGDGRLKPDLVAPGERIVSAVPNNLSAVMDGTSMAAPHVSGVAALLLAKYPEFRGKPQRVKEILMATATDLKRERYFQGAGLVDAMRALQSV